MGSAVETLCGQAYEAHKYEMLDVYAQRSTILLTGTRILLTVLYAFSKQLLLLLGESTGISTEGAVFIYGLIPQIFVYACNFPLQKFLQSQSVVFPGAVVSASGLCLHLLLVVVYVLDWGLLDAALTLSFSWWLIVLGQFAYIVFSDRFKHTWRGFTWQAFTGLWSFLKLSTASAVMLCLESWYGVGCGIASQYRGCFGCAFCLHTTISGWVYMILVGFNASASVRVGNEIGAGHPKSVAFAVMVVVVTATSSVIAVMIAILVLLLRALHQRYGSFGCRRPTLSILGRYYYTQWYPTCSFWGGSGMWMASIRSIREHRMLLLCRSPISVLLGFKFGFGVRGIWSGMIGGTLLQTLILIFVTYRTD